MKKILIIVLVLVLSLSLVYADGSEKSAEKTYGELLKEISLINGKGDKGLAPEDELNRQEMVVILIRMGGLLDEFEAFEAPSSPSFSDVPSKHWAYKYIEFALSKGITKGQSEGVFGLNANVNAKQAALFLSRTIGYKEDKVGGEAIKYNSAYTQVSKLLDIDCENVKDDSKSLIRGEIFEMMYKSLLAKDITGKAYYTNIFASDDAKKEVLATSVGKIKSDLKTGGAAQSAIKDTKNSSQASEDIKADDFIISLAKALKDKDYEFIRDAMKGEKFSKLSDGIDTFENRKYKIGEEFLVIYNIDKSKVSSQLLHNYDSIKSHPFIYLGKIENEKRSGNGIWFSYFDEFIDYYAYNGEWENDLPNGKGKIYRKNNVESINKVSKAKLPDFIACSLSTEEGNLIDGKYDGKFVIEYEMVDSSQKRWRPNFKKGEPIVVQDNGGEFDIIALCEITGHALVKENDEYTVIGADFKK